MRRVWALFCAASLIFLFNGCKFKINQSYSIRDNSVLGSGVTTINGSIHIGSNCKVNGKCMTVNGVISVDDNSIVKNLQTVNGGISVGRNCEVRGSLESVNGGVDCEAGTVVRKKIRTVNGDIQLDSTIVNRDLVTYNGDISLQRNSRVLGDIRIKSGKGDKSRIHHITIKLEKGSVVEGDIFVDKDPTLDVTVFVSNDSKVKGMIRNAKTVEK